MAGRGGGLEHDLREPVRDASGHRAGATGGEVVDYHRQPCSSVVDVHRKFVAGVQEQVGRRAWRERGVRQAKLSRRRVRDARLRDEGEVCGLEPYCGEAARVVHDAGVLILIEAEYRHRGAPLAGVTADARRPWSPAGWIKLHIEERR